MARTYPDLVNIVPTDSLVAQVPGKVQSRLNDATALQQQTRTLDPNATFQVSADQTGVPSGYQRITVNGQAYVLKLQSRELFTLNASGSLTAVDRGAAVTYDISEGSTIVASGSKYSGQAHRDPSLGGKDDAQYIGTGNDAEELAVLDIDKQLQVIESQKKTASGITFYLKQFQGLGPCDNCTNMLKWLAQRHPNTPINVYFVDAAGQVHLKTFIFTK